jgi:SAM-dependent methyltransferase
MPGPWWIERVRQLLADGATSAGGLWNLTERLSFVRENVDPIALELDFTAVPGAREAWSAFEVREHGVQQALRHAVAGEAAALKSGARSHAELRRHWESLGFARNAEGAGTPADDYLDALCGVSRYTAGEALPPFGTPNMSSRAVRISEFLALFGPGPSDVVYDLGSGSGKVALTLAASSDSQVLGVELGASYVEAARSTGAALGLRNVTFVCADVREVDLSSGTHFYLNYPFRDAVARATAEALGAIARRKPISVYLFGPQNGFREHFDAQISAGAFRLLDRRGEFLEVMALASA